MSVTVYFVVDPTEFAAYKKAMDLWQEMTDKMQNLMDRTFKGHEEMYHGSPSFEVTGFKLIDELESTRRLGSQRGGGFHWDMARNELNEEVARGRIIVEVPSYTEVSLEDFMRAQAPEVVITGLSDPTQWPVGRMNAGEELLPDTWMEYMSTPPPQERKEVMRYWKNLTRGVEAAQDEVRRYFSEPRFVGVYTDEKGTIDTSRYK